MHHYQEKLPKADDPGADGKNSCHVAWILIHYAVW